MAVNSDSARISTSLLAVIDALSTTRVEVLSLIMLTPTAIWPELPEMPAAEESATVVTLVFVRDLKVTSVAEMLASSSTERVAWLSIAENAPVKATPTDCAVAVVVESVTASDVTATSPDVDSRLVVPVIATSD